MTLHLAINRGPLVIFLSSSMVNKILYGQKGKGPSHQQDNNLDKLTTYLSVNCTMPCIKG